MKAAIIGSRGLTVRHPGQYIPTDTKGAQPNILTIGISQIASMCKQTSKIFEICLT